MLIYKLAWLTCFLEPLNNMESQIHYFYHQMLLLREKKDKKDDNANVYLIAGTLQGASQPYILKA